jgi:glucose-6-phosphate-specific signal transduction histidine kinase
MNASLGLLGAPRRHPWFRRRPALAVIVAGLLFAGVLALRMLTSDPADAYSLLFAFPVALIAISFGFRGGAAAGGVAVLLMVVWVATTDATLSPAGWASRSVPILLLGALLGEATDRMNGAEAEYSEMKAAALLHREAIEINDSLVQGMAAAKWSLEGGQVDTGLRILDDTLARAQDLVSGLIREANMGGQTEQLPTGPVSDRTVREAL